MEQRPKPAAAKAAWPLKDAVNEIFNGWADGVLWTCFYARQLELLEEYPELFEAVAGCS